MVQNRVINGSLDAFEAGRKEVCCQGHEVSGGWTCLERAVVVREGREGDEERRYQDRHTRVQSYQGDGDGEDGVKANSE